MNWPLLYTAVAITTSAALLLELSLTRIFSVVFYYHFAFLAISIALFGMGVGGVLFVCCRRQHPQVRSSAKLGIISLVNSFLVVAALLFILSRGANVSTLDFALIYIACALPFLGVGMIVSLAINETVDRIDKVYFADLSGAAAGCIALVVFLNTFGGPNTVVAVSVLFAAAAAIWFNLAGLKFGRIASVGVGLFFAMLIIVNIKPGFLEVRYGKGQKLKDEQFHKWNSISRIGLSGNMIYIDADASTGIANFDFEHLTLADRKVLLNQGPGTPYILRPGAKTLIIGPGGGWDVSRALASGSHDVTAVEINPIIANTIMRDKFPQLSNRLYFRPDVHLNVEDGRAFVRRSPEKFQVIQATLVDTWASTAAGAFALSENNLYTTDAFRDYFSHLTDDGLLTFTRWGFDPPRESLRLCCRWLLSLCPISGITTRPGHVIVGRSGAVTDSGGWGAQDTVLFSRKPLSDGDVARARDAFASAGMEPVYLPGDIPHNPFGELLTSSDPVAYERSYGFDITPVSDDRPFFFYTVQPRDVPAYLLATAGKAADTKTNIALPKLIQAMFISIAAIVVILILPPLVLGARLPKNGAVRWFLPYFLAIGIGYILIEVALIQKFVLFLGHPTYALTVVIFSLLLASGAGSFFSRSLIGGRRDRLVTVLGIAFALVAVLAAVVPPLLTAGVGLRGTVKVLLTVALLAPAGFAMGMPFPTALRMLDRHHSSAVRWAWSLNAAASVAGSVGALVLGLYLGLMQTLLLGGALYLVALALAAASPVCSAMDNPARTRQ